MFSFKQLSRESINNIKIELSEICIVFRPNNNFQKKKHSYRKHFKNFPKEKEKARK